MGRSVPKENNNTNNITLKDPFLNFSFCMLGFVTSIAIISALCSVRLRRKSSSSSAPAPLSSDHDDDSHVLNIEHEHEHQQRQHPSTSEGSATTLENTTTTTRNDNDDEALVKELPLPPALQQHPSLKRATSERMLSFNLSKKRKMLRSFSMAKNWNHHQKKENNNDGGKKMNNNNNKLLFKTTPDDEESVWMKTKGKLKNDDSVWMKTIILGGKCVPDEEDDAVIYEGKGKRISAYHPRKSLSRQCSYISNGAFSLPQSHEERINQMSEDKKK